MICVKKNLLKVLLVVLACAALLSLSIGAWRAVQSGGSQDFQYSSAHLMLNGVNPYAIWLISGREHFLLSQDPIYFPNMYYLLAPIAALDWPKAKCLWMIVNGALAGYFAWLLYAAQKRPGENCRALLIALFFLSATPVRSVIGNGQQSILILVATAWAMRHRSKPLLSGLAFSVSLAKYSFGLFFLAAEVGRRRIIAPLIAFATVFACYVGLSIQTHSPFNFSLLFGPMKVGTTVYTFTNHFLWLNQHFGSSSVMLFSALGLAIVFLRACVLSATSLPSNEVDIKLACGAAFSSLLFGPHHTYDFVMLALPLAVGCRLDNLKRFERYLYSGVLLTFWIIPGFLEIPRDPIVAGVKNVLLVLALGLLIYVFLAKASNQISPVEDGVNAQK
jgi:hypothetical protein